MAPRWVGGQAGLACQGGGHHRHQDHEHQHQEKGGGEQIWRLRQHCPDVVEIGQMAADELERLLCLRLCFSLSNVFSLLVSLNQGQNVQCCKANMASLSLRPFSNQQGTTSIMWGHDFGGFPLYRGNTERELPHKERQYCVVRINSKSGLIFLLFILSKAAKRRRNKHGRLVW